MTTAEKYQVYRNWCRENNLPCFVPHDGKCFSCGKPVFDDDATGTKGYPAEGEFITGCPHCHRTFCD